MTDVLNANEVALLIRALSNLQVSNTKTIQTAVKHAGPTSAAGLATQISSSLEAENRLAEDLKSRLDEAGDVTIQPSD